ncbi:MAG: glutamine-hydrolyzing carbamoyl-phosphate synthase small subunit [Xanthomonadales bacterium]|nr:glutamine-hydrolyzing carbamoyl-phosphate synthase small subunit [Xanthomonadales bacterium]
MTEQAILALEDGTIFRGQSIGAAGRAVGEVVFNTAMSGYQEILTDPSYARQMVTLTYPHIGNTGCNAVDEESARPMAEGLIIRDLPLRVSSWRSESSLSDYLQSAGVVGIADIDTRKLTRLLRTSGAQNGCIVAGPDADGAEAAALAAAREFPGLQGMDLAQVVTTDDSYAWEQGSYDLDDTGFGQSTGQFHVVAFDYGIKRNILRMLCDRGCRVTVLPARASSEDALALKPDGVFLSNGPGDPEPCDYAIKAISEILQQQVPVFGICLGHQLLSLACGAATVKMKFGHHGANHPVQDLATGQVVITSQNHGFAVDEDSLPEELEATHRSLFDGSLQGVRHRKLPAFGFQGHPEASPGPHDIGYLFDQFVTAMSGGQEAGD